MSRNACNYADNRQTSIYKGSRAKGCATGIYRAEPQNQEAKIDRPKVSLFDFLSSSKGLKTLWQSELGIGLDACMSVRLSLAALVHQEGPLEFETQFFRPFLLQ